MLSGFLRKHFLNLFHCSDQRFLFLRQSPEGIGSSVKTAIERNFHYSAPWIMWVILFLYPLFWWFFDWFNRLGELPYEQGGPHSSQNTKCKRKETKNE